MPRWLSLVRAPDYKRAILIILKNQVSDEPSGNGWYKGSCA